jgi:hypothetical protein
VEVAGVVDELAASRPATHGVVLMGEHSWPRQGGRVPTAQAGEGRMARWRVPWWSVVEVEYQGGRVVPTTSRPVVTVSIT